MPARGRRESPYLAKTSKSKQSWVITIDGYVPTLAQYVYVPSGAVEGIAWVNECVRVPWGLIVKVVGPITGFPG